MKLLASRRFRTHQKHLAVVTLAALTGMAGGPVSAQIVLSGANYTWPTNNIAISSPNADIGNNALGIGSSPSSGSLSVGGGSLLRAGALLLGYGGAGTGSAVINGVGTKVELYGDGFSDGVLDRLEVGSWGVGSLRVENGAILNARVNPNACLGQFHYCHTFIGNGAGSTGTLTVTGTGSSASFLRGFYVGGVSVFHPPIDTFTFGTPGGTTQGRVEVLAGGLLRTEGATLGMLPGGGSPSGSERSFADVLVSGAGSTWLLERRSLDNLSASLVTGSGGNAWATITVDNGGKLRMEGAPGVYNFANLSAGGRTDVTVTGAGSRWEMAGANMQLNVGSGLGTANFQVTAGGVVDGVLLLNVGRDGSTGRLTVDGAGSRVNLYGTGVAGTGDANGAASLQIGRNGTGTVTVSNGGRIDMAATGVTTRGPGLLLGVSSGSSGTLNISGSNSVVSLTAQSAVPGGGNGEAFNPFASIGFDGSGALNISAGGKLLLDGNAVSTPTVSRATTLYVGGRNTGIAGGNGIARVSGAGSEIRVTGSDANLGVGVGPNSTGQLFVSDAANIVSTTFNVGVAGGIGVVRFDNGSANLSGQFTGGSLVGAGMSIGDGSGSTGVVNMSNGARITITNTGSAGTGVTIGGSPLRTGGDGTLNMSGGSTIQVIAPAATSGMSVGRTGTGLVRMNASTIDLGSGSLFVGRTAGSDGTMIVSGGSSVTAGWVGIGRDRTGDGGTGTVIVNGSTLTASTIEIGPNGYLGGNGTIVGNIVNYGIVSPGNSPGTITVDGSFVNGLGGRLLLEVESDGHGGFNTDHLIFNQGTTVSLTGLDVRFRFLGATDPNAFKAAGLFNINQFFQQAGAGGQLGNLAPEVFAGATFGAQADGYTFNSFSFSVAGGASFTAAPVPEPGESAMLLAGLALIGAVVRRRATRART